MSTSDGFATCSTTRMAKKRKFAKMTPEEHARRDETQRLARERIAEREAREQEMERRRARKSLGRRLLERLKLAA